MDLHSLLYNHHTTNEVTDVAYLLKADWTWLIEHAEAKTENGVERWTCRTTGVRMLVSGIPSLVNEEEGKKIAGVILSPHCPGCEMFRPMSMAPKQTYTVHDVIRVSEVK